jgi:two-component system CheB/CheR fusion protein
LDLPQKDDDVVRQIISLLRIRKGADFTHYKKTTIHRRIVRRMALSKNEDPGAYLNYLREHKEEQDVLYQDLLIPVTSFFREPNAFDYLLDTILPLIVKSKQSGEPIRVWVAGCSTGEEAYSIAISI